MKFCVFLLFQLLPWLALVGDWALRWTEGNEAVQIAFVMLIFPLVMNALQYWIIDSFIKEPTQEAHSPVPQTDDSDAEDEQLLGPPRHSVDSDDESDAANDLVGAREARDKANKRLGTRAGLKEANPTPVDAEYDPATDGEAGSSRPVSAEADDKK